MIVSAFAKNVRMSDQKVRVVINGIKKLNVEKAIDVLTFSNKKAAFILNKVIRSVVANAEHNYGLDIDNLYIYNIYVNKASSFKRFRARAKGRSNKIIKRNCHIYVSVKERI